MPLNLTRNKVEALLEEARQSFPHDECLTCECFLGYLTQLGMDAGEEINSLFEALEINYHRTHGCMGCDPCPPADLFAEYLKQRSQ